ncbi:hypothetical protein ABVT39_007165 [Epinephelus coioides]
MNHSDDDDGGDDEGLELEEEEGLMRLLDSLCFPIKASDNEKQREQDEASSEEEKLKVRRETPRDPSAPKQTLLSHNSTKDTGQDETEGTLRTRRTAEETPSTYRRHGSDPAVRRQRLDGSRDGSIDQRKDK